DAIRNCATQRIVDIDPELRSAAGECGYRSMLVAIGATESLDANCEVISYEAPFGVGYLVAQLTNSTDEAISGAAAKESVASASDESVPSASVGSVPSASADGSTTSA